MRRINSRTRAGSSRSPRCLPRLKVLATGSSTLAATTKFRDSLTGRKREVALTPVLAEELPAFGVSDIQVRLFRGGLPQALLAAARDPEFYGEWLDSYYARDVQELFHLGKRSEFLRMLELVLRQSGGMLEITSLAKHTGVSRATVEFLAGHPADHPCGLPGPSLRGGRAPGDPGPTQSLRVRHRLRLLRQRLGRSASRGCPGCSGSTSSWTPFARPSAPRIHSGATSSTGSGLRPSPGAGCGGRHRCKWNPDAFEPRGLQAFRDSYPKGRNYLLCPGVRHRTIRRAGELEWVPSLPIGTCVGNHPSLEVRAMADRLGLMALNQKLLEGPASSPRSMWSRPGRHHGGGCRRPGGLRPEPDEVGRESARKLNPEILQVTIDIGPVSRYEPLLRSTDSDYDNEDNLPSPEADNQSRLDRPVQPAHNSQSSAGEERGCPGRMPRPESYNGHGSGHVVKS